MGGMLSEEPGKRLKRKPDPSPELKVVLVSNPPNGNGPYLELSQPTQRPDGSEKTEKFVINCQALANIVEQSISYSSASQRVSEPPRETGEREKAERKAGDPPEGLEALRFPKHGINVSLSDRRETPEGSRPTVELSQTA